jgi:hypothetical protein
MRSVGQQQTDGTTQPKLILINAQVFNFQCKWTRPKQLATTFNRQMVQLLESGKL